MPSCPGIGPECHYAAGVYLSPEINCMVAFIPPTRHDCAARAVYVGGGKDMRSLLTDGTAPKGTHELRRVHTTFKPPADVDHLRSRLDRHCRSL
jgi:hypothetical protein